MEFLSKLRRAPSSQLKLLIFGDRERIYINICKRRGNLQIFFTLSLQDLLLQLVKTFKLIFHCILFCKATVDKPLFKFHFQFIFIKFCTETLLF